MRSANFAQEEGKTSAMIKSHEVRQPKKGGAPIDAEPLSRPPRLKSPASADLLNDYKDSPSVYDPEHAVSYKSYQDGQ